MKVLEQMIHDCQTGLNKRMPIVWIKTSEIEIVRRIVGSECFTSILRNSADGWELVSEKEAQRAWHSADKNGNILFLDAQELMKYFTEDKIKALSDSSKEPAHVIISKAETITKQTDRFWSSLMPFIDSHSMDFSGETPIGRSVIVLFSERADIPSDYTPYCHIVEEPYPQKKELTEIVTEKLEKIYPDEYKRINLVSEMLGFSLIRAEQITAYIARLFGDEHTRKKIEEENAKKKDKKDWLTPEKIIVDERNQELKRNDLLSLENVPKGIRAAGMKVFEEWMDKQKLYLKESDGIRNETGASAPKGVLLCGIPGTGKSAAAKMFADITGLKLIRMDIGRLMGGLVGDSEHNMQKALKIADATAPCILFIDELDKSFEGAKSSSGSGSNDTFRRMFATLLTWMQSHESSCFVFATANDISVLPKEFFRSGRFDCMFSLFMPTYAECVEIFKYHIKCRIGAYPNDKNDNRLKSPFSNFDAENLSIAFMNILSLKERFVTGADIEKLVELTLRKVYSQLKENSSKFHNENQIQLSEMQAIFEVVLTGDKNEIGTSVYGDSKEQFDSIALCYIRLLRNNFVPVSSTRLLYDYEAVRKENDSKENPQSVGDGWPEFNVTVKMLNEGISPYDKNLAAKLKDLIEFYGPKYEQEMLKKMF